MSGNDAFAKLLLHCDGADTTTTFTDDSPSARGNATVNGNAQVDTAQSVFGGASLLCDGTGDWLSYADSADWNMGAGGGGDFTFDFRVRMAAISATANGFISTNPDNDTTGYQFYCTTTSLRVNTGGGTDRGVAWSPAINTWYHIAYVRSGTTVTLFVDGTSIGTVADGDFNNDGNTINLGYLSSAGFALNGWMDEIRVSKGTARWTANFTPPSAAYSADGTITPMLHQYRLRRAA